MKFLNGTDHAQGDTLIEIEIDDASHHGDIDKNSTLITYEQRSEWIIE